MLATPTDYTNWTGAAPPANITPILRACTSLVMDAAETAFYDVDTTTGLATDAQTLAAMRDATCIQAAAWVALGIDPNLGGVTTATIASSKKIGTASIVRDTADVAAASAARQAALTGLVPDAMRMLQQNNLLAYGPWTFG
jgi:hypothetical protein